MSRTRQNISKAKRGGYDLWGKRPKAGTTLSAYNKRICRRVERRQHESAVLDDILSDGYCGFSQLLRTQIYGSSSAAEKN